MTQSSSIRASCSTRPAAATSSWSSSTTRRSARCGRIESAKSIDFGIAKASEAGEKTIIGSDFSGKYSFASPEQIGMHGGKVDARSDIYSLGLVLAAAALGHGARLDMGRS